MNTRMEWMKMSARPRASQTDCTARLSDCQMLRLSLSVKENDQLFVCSDGSDDSEAKEDGKKKTISC